MEQQLVLSLTLFLNLYWSFLNEELSVLNVSMFKPASSFLLLYSQHFPCCTQWPSSGVNHTWYAFWNFELKPFIQSKGVNSSLFTFHA